MDQLRSLNGSITDEQSYRTGGGGIQGLRGLTSDDDSRQSKNAWNKQNSSRAQPNQSQSEKYSSVQQPNETSS